MGAICMMSANPLLLKEKLEGMKSLPIVEGGVSDAIVPQSTLFI